MFHYPFSHPLDPPLHVPIFLDVVALYFADNACDLHRMSILHKLSPAWTQYLDQGSLAKYTETTFYRTKSKHIYLRPDTMTLFYTLLPVTVTFSYEIIEKVQADLLITLLTSHKSDSIVSWVAYHLYSSVTFSL